MQSRLFQPFLPVHLCDVYIMHQPNQTVSQRSVHFSVVGALLLIFSIFRKPCSHLLLTKSHPSSRAQLTSPLIHISFLILPTGCDIYLRWALKALCMHLSYGTELILPYVLVICDLDCFLLRGGWRAGTMSSLFLKLLEVNAPGSSRRSFLRRLKVDWVKKGQFVSSRSFHYLLDNIAQRRIYCT